MQHTTNELVNYLRDVSLGISQQDNEMTSEAAERLNSIADALSNAVSVMENTISINIDGEYYDLLRSIFKDLQVQSQEAVNRSSGLL